MLDNLLFWNCRGLGSSKTRLRAMLKVLKQKILIIAEPFCQDYKLACWQGMLKFDVIRMVIRVVNCGSSGKMRFKLIFFRSRISMLLL
jgi:hypothetical protein